MNKGASGSLKGGSFDDKSTSTGCFFAKAEAMLDADVESGLLKAPPGLNAAVAEPEEDRLAARSAKEVLPWLCCALAAKPERDVVGLLLWCSEARSCWGAPDDDSTAFRLLAAAKAASDVLC